MKSFTLAIIIPAYNEENSVSDVLQSLPKTIKGVDRIVSIVIDDGSTDLTYHMAKKYATHVIKQVLNLGTGAATITGFEAAKKIRADVCVSIDADGQHDPNDIEKLIQPILNDQADVVLGTRMKNTKGMPLVKIIGNWIMNAITFAVFSRWTSDSQSGMRAISRKALARMDFQATGYEICSELIGEVQRNHLKMIEIPIRVIYTHYSKIKGQSMLNAVNIFTKILFIRVGNLK